MTIWISRELPLFNFERLEILCTQIGHPSETLSPFECLKASVVQFWASRYIISLNRTSEWKVMTIGISRELPLFKFECLDILCPQIGHPCEKLWPFEFLESFRCSISSVPIYFAPESDIRVRSYDNLNFSRAFVVQFRVPQYIIRLNRKPELKVLTIWISREVLLL